MSGAASSDAPIAADPAVSTASAPSPDIQCNTITTPSGAPMEICDHGPDNPPDLTLGLPLESYPQFTPPALQPQATAGLECYGDGVSGMRVQAVYVVPTGGPPVAGRIDQIKTYAARGEAEGA